MNILAHPLFNVPLPADGNISDLEDDNGTDDENVTFEDLESETKEEITESDSETEEEIIESDSESEEEII